MHGRWSRAGVPHTGWTCVGVEDLGSLAAVCEMCEHQEIRYVHRMSHADYPDEMAVGCVCASRMERDPEMPARRERGLRNTTNRRSRWLQRAWRISAQGNEYVNTDGMNIAIFRRTGGSWGARLADRVIERKAMFIGPYGSADEAKLAAFDAMISLKNEEGWGKHS